MSNSQPHRTIFALGLGTLFYAQLLLFVVNSLGREVGRLLVEVLERVGRVGVERRLPREALVEDGAQGPEVGLGGVGRVHDDLWGHVHGGSAQGAAHLAVLEEAGEAEVG